MLEHVAFYSDHDRGFLIDRRTGDLYRLNATGVLILKSIRSGESPSRIVAELCKEYQVAPEQAEDDFETFMERLRDRGIIQ